jgi:hypothetical protein
MTELESGALGLVSQSSHFPLIATVALVRAEYLWTPLEMLMFWALAANCRHKNISTANSLKGTVDCNFAMRARQGRVGSPGSLLHAASPANR